MAEYLWVDGRKPTPGIRSKTRILDIESGKRFEDFAVANLPVWGFDGSSTEQASGGDSDCVLRPIAFWYDPLRNTGNETFPHLIVLNEVEHPDGRMHTSNTRARLRELAAKFADQEFWFGIEQEYTLFKGHLPLGFADGLPEPQGKYYCGAGADRIFGRDIAEDHMKACLKANVLFTGINAEVMPGQWEYQIGTGGPLAVADNLIFARWLCTRIGEKYGVGVSIDPKPATGDWNGAGCHTNFSNKAMRESASVFQEIIAKFEAKHKDHVEVYGADIEKRLTGLHETCDVNTFKAGVSDRGASIRIPWHVHKAGKGYLEDRRPNSNMDPYLVLARIMETISGSSSATMEQSIETPQTSF